MLKEAFRKKDRLWTSSFLFLWHGQLASAFGDRMYTIAIGFWVLAVSKSTALMGILMAIMGVPRIIVPPFAGMIMDRVNKKILLVLTNAIRGIFVIFIGIAILIGFVQVWMLFFAGLIINLCGALFNPVVKSSLPNIVHRSNLEKANSITDMIRAGMVIVGNFVGGLLIQLLGASQVFLLNGISYLISAATGLLIQMPEEELFSDPGKTENVEDEIEYNERMRDLRYPLVISAVINFLGNIGLILFLPLFQRMKMSHTGLDIVFGFVIGSLILGILFTCIVNIPPERRLLIFIGSNVISGVGYAAWPLVSQRPLLLGLIFIMGLFGAVYNVFITSNIQLIVPEKIRGQVFGLPGMVFPGLAPVAMAVAGILAEFISIKVLIFAAQMLILLLVIPMAKISSFKRFINFNPERETLMDIV